MKSRIDRTLFIFISFIFGMIIGFRLLAGKLTMMIGSETITNILGITGITYLYIFRVLILPTTFISVVYGVLKMQELKDNGPIGRKTLKIYMVTTVFSIILAVVVVLVIKPGELSREIVKNFDFLSTELPVNVYRFLLLVQEKFMLKHIEGKAEILVVFSLIIGILVSQIRNHKLIQFMKGLNIKLLRVGDLVLLTAPIGVFSIMTMTFSRYGYDVLIPVGKYFLTVILIYVIQIVIVYQLLLFIIAGLNPIKFLKKIYFALKIAFSTSSSNATLPVTMDMLENNFGVSKCVSQYTLPIGATINMDGSAILYGSATVFLAQLYGVSMDGLTIVGVVVFSTITSIATSGVSSVGIFMLAIVLDYVGIPLEGLFLVIGLERILDMTSTLVNVAGDAVCTLIVAKGEKELDENVYNYE